jgi:NIMA (never in mitosis gene a)-related kinase|tara:strand:+ start:322 stop:480 length:159 start_codon:yes stop_codon:yes gene_type:complete
MSPEMLKEERYDAKSDIWSLGILLYEMCALQHPFTGSTLKEVADAVHKCEYE